MNMGVSQNNKRIAKNTVYLYIRMLFVMFITLLTTRKLLSTLGVEDYGLYNVVCGFVNMFAFLNTSMANGIQRFYNYEIGKNGDRNIGRIFTHAFVIQFCIAIIIIILLETIGIWYLYFKMMIPEGRFNAAFWIFQLSMIQLFITVVTVPYSAAVMAYEKMNFYAYVGIIDAILKLVIVYLLRYTSIDQLIFYGFLLAIISILNFFINLFYCKKNFTNLIITKVFDKKLLFEILSFSGWNIFGTGAHMIERQGINLVFNAFWGTIVNAANGIASQVIAAITSLTSGFVTAVRPQMIKSYALGNVKYLQKMYYSASKLTFYLIMLLAVPMICEISIVLDFWLGRGKYPEFTTLFCQISMIIALTNSYATPSSIIAHATGKMKKFQVTVSFTILLILPIAYISARFGCKPYIILLISAFLNIIVQIVRLFIIREQIGFLIFEYIKRVFCPTWIIFSLTLVSTMVVDHYMPHQLTYAIISIGISIVLSIVYIFSFGLTEPEKSLIISFVKSKSNSK